MTVPAVLCLYANQPQILYGSLNLALLQFAKWQQMTGHAPGDWVLWTTPHIFTATRKICTQPIFFFQFLAHTRGIHINCIYDIVATKLDLLIFAVRIINVWNGLPVDRVDFSFFVTFNRLILHRFHLVSRLRFTGLLLVPLCGLLVYSHIVCIVYSLFVLLYSVWELNDDDDDEVPPPHIQKPALDSYQNAQKSTDVNTLLQKKCDKVRGPHTGKRALRTNRNNEVSALDHSELPLSFARWMNDCVEFLTSHSTQSRP